MPAYLDVLRELDKPQVFGSSGTYSASPKHLPFRSTRSRLRITLGEEIAVMKSSERTVTGKAQEVESFGSALDEVETTSLGLRIKVKAGTDRSPLRRPQIAPGAVQPED
jgi:hypothetical protein